jgi:hypothetical protein
MSRFQATTNAVTDSKLEEVRDALGLRSNDQAGLLSELADMAHWIVTQSQKGRVIQAKGADSTEALVHPSLGQAEFVKVYLTTAQAARLSELMESPPESTIKLSKTIQRIQDPERQPPELDWGDA